MRLMKWIAALMLVSSFGILEGSDVQGFEITTSMYILLLTNLMGAGAILYAAEKNHEWH